MEYKNKIITLLIIVIIFLVGFIFFSNPKSEKVTETINVENQKSEDRSSTPVLTLDKRMSDFFGIDQSTKNDGIGFYADSLNLFGTSTVAKRIKTLLVNNGVYDEVVKNFNVGGALENVPGHDGIYHITGCKVHACPSYFIDIYFDLNNNNINIIVDHESSKFFEKGPISLPWILGDY